MRPLGAKFYNRLRLLGNGCIVVAPRKRDWTPLLRRGWVESAGWSSREIPGRLPPLQITAAGLRALADWLDERGGVWQGLRMSGGERRA